MTRRAASRPSPVAAAIGARASARLLDLGCGQAELARRAEVSKSAVGRLLLGESVPQPASLLRIAGALGVSVQWLAHGETSSPVPVGASEAIVRTAFAAMPPARRRALLVEFLSAELRSGGTPQ